MGDSGHIAALAEAESLSGAAVGGRTQAFAWRRIIAALVLLVAIAVGGYRFLWPASYEGEVRWGRGFETLTLVEADVQLDVSDNSLIYSRTGETLSPDFLRSPLIGSQSEPFAARVVYRPYLRPKSGTVGRVQTIVAR